MQQTRFNTLLEVTSERLNQFFTNPWRRISLLLIGLLFGVFVGEAISTTVGQQAKWDVVAAALVLLFTEGVSRWVYPRRPKAPTPSRLWIEVLNVFKIGVAYSLYLEAFKLGS